jgi:SpoIID/LytB domain protein
VYGPIEHEAPASTAAVTATVHRVVWYRSTVATTFFSSSSGGRTASEQAAWGTATGQPYLVPVIDRYDAAGGANPYHNWPATTYTPAGLARALGLSGVVGSVAMTIDGPSQRILHLAVTSSRGTSTLSGVQVQGRMGLRSNYFRILQRTLVVPRTAVAGRPFTVTGRAWPKPTGGVTLQRRTTAAGPWQVSVAHVKLGAKGNFSLSFHPTANRWYRLVSAGRAVSPTVSVKVEPALRLAVKGGHFQGTMYPALSGQALVLFRHTASGWVSVESETAGPKGHAAFTTAPATGTWRIHYDGDATHRRGHSPAIAIP